MYRILYNDSIIFDPYGNDNEVVSDASMSVKINAAAYMDFTMPRLHPLYNTIAERDGVVTLYWDKDILFQGTIESIDMDINGNKAVSCVSALDYLNDTVVRPYSTIAGEQELTAPSSVDGYFQWLIDQHNKHVKDSNKLFYIGVNQGANLQRNNFIYRSSTNNPTTASEISNQIIDSLGGYLLMRYEDGRHILDLYSDVHTMNAQIIDFGVNLKDFSKKIDTNDQYTALIAKGGSPQFMNGGFESGDFSYWESHPDTSIVTDKAQEGSYSSYVIKGVAKYVPASFFYAKKNGRYKSTVYVKNERPSNIVIHAGYQTNVLDSWSNDSKTVPFTIPNDDQWHECSYEFSTGVENNTKIRPYWYSDNMSNSGNRRVYFDGFEFSRLIGNNTVSEDPINLTLIPNGGTRYDSDIIKSEDVIYNPNRVSRYGYREKVFTDSTITDVEDLMQAAIKELNKLAEPTIGLDVKAIDLALYMDGYTHLNVGDAVRVRSAIHDTDEYLMVSSINLNLQDPENSEYVIGQAYDSLTGQQSGYLRWLSAGINSSLDAVASLDQATKDQAIKLGSVTKETKKAQDTADSASSKADNAKESADKAQQTANSNKEQISAVKDKQSEHDALIEQAKKDIAASEAEISGINDRMTQMDSDIDKAQSDIDVTRQEAQKNFDTANAAANAAQQRADTVAQDLEKARQEAQKNFDTANAAANAAQSKADTVAQDLEKARQEAQKNFDTANAAANAAQSKADSVGSDLESFRTETNTAVQNVRDSVSKTQTDVDAVTKKASDLSDDLDATKATVSQTVTEFGEVKTTATNAASKADQSLQVSTQASQTATSASQKATSAYNDAQTAITKSSEAVQTANSVSLSLKTDYQTKADADKKYATKSSLTATSDQIKSEVSKTYATQATVNALENIANNAVQTWMGTGAPTLTNKPASDWSTAALKTQHSGDIYYDTDTGYSYRFGSSDGSTYSWALIKDTDISKAIADAAKAQKTADSATSGVSELKSSIPVTYATKTELTQKADSITSRVEEVAQAGTTTSSKVTQLEQKTDEIKSTVSEQGSKLNNAVTTISQVSQKADSISTSLSQTNKNLNALSSNMIKNPGFETGDFTNWSYTDSSKVHQLYVNSGSQLAGTYKAVIWFPSTDKFILAANSMSVAKDHTYEISCWIWSDKNVTIRLGFQADALDATNQLYLSGTTGWQRISTTWKFQRVYTMVVPRIVFPEPISDSFPVRLDNFEVRDITEGVEASGTANSALSKASSLEQNLDGFKTTVAQTYESKNDALAKQSALTQTVNGFKTEVAQTYETKTNASNTKSSLEQSINGFKTEVSDTYETKTDAGKKQSSLTQTIDGFKTEVAQKYETKTDASSMKSSLEQSLNGFKTTVSQTYATKTALDTTNGKVTQAQATGDQAIFAALPSLADKTRPNSWLCAIFPTGNGSVQTLPSYSLLASLAASDTKYQADSRDIIQGSGLDYHYGLIRTLVSFAANTTWTFTYSHDDGSRIYVDGVVVFESAHYTLNDSVTITFTKGNHIVDIMYFNGAGGYGIWGFSVPLSSIATTMYAPAGASALATALDKAQKDVTTALSQYSTLSQDLTGFKTTVAQTYETKNDSLNKQSTLNQTINGFKTNVAQTYETKSDALKKQSSLTQTIDGFKTSVAQTYETKSDSLAAQSALTQTVNGFKTEVSQKYATNKSLAAISSNMIKNPGFETGGLEPWTIVDGMANVYVNNQNPHSGSYKLVITTPSTKSWVIRSNDILVVAGHTYEISMWAWADSAVTGKLGIYAAGNWSTSEVNIPASSDWTRISVRRTLRASYSNAKISFGFSNAISESNNIRLDDFEIRDITEGVDAGNTANAAISKTSTLEQNLDGFKTTVAQSYETKNDALKKQSSLNQTIDGFKTSVAQTYETKNDSLSKQSALTQTINGFKSDVAQTYETKNDSLNKQSTLNQTINGFKTTVSATYATKTSLDSLSNKSDVTYPMVTLSNANNYWIRLGTATISQPGRIAQLTLNVSKGNNGRPDQNAKAIIQIHRGWTGGDASHQFGVSVDNSNWKDIQVKAISGATNKVTIWVYNSVSTYLKGNYTVSGWRDSWEDQGLTQTAAPTGTAQQVAMNVSLEDVNDIASSALKKSTTLEQRVDGITSTVSEQAKKLDNTVTTVSQVSQKADSISSTVRQVQGDLNSLDFGGTNLVKLGYYNFDGHTTNGSYNRDQDLYTFTVPANLPHSTWGYGLFTRDKSYVYAGVPWGKCGILSFYIYADRACTINIDVNNAPMIASAGSGNDHDNTSKREHSSYSIPANQWVQVWTRWENSNSTDSTGNPTKDDLYDASEIGVISSSNAVNVKIKKIKFEVGTKPTAWSPCPADVDANIGTAQGTANSALSKASTVEQTLDGFKTDVSQTYETKNDALSKQATLTQKVDNLRSEVSATYTKKDDFNNASSTTNMWPNQWFDTSKPLIGRAPVGSEIEAAPVGGNIRIIDGRDNYSSSVKSSVTPGRTYRVSVDAKKISGTKSVISGGIWYTSQTSGNSWDGVTDFTSVHDYGNGWHRFERTITVPANKTRGRVWLQLSENNSSSTTAKWKISNLRFEDVTDIADIQANYSTKSYVDQTSRTVSLGVVEEYKKGQHGSALATASDITAAKDSITSTVSKTYLSKSDASTTYASKSEVKQTVDGLNVTIGGIRSTADSAVTKANNAQSTADTANNKANNAQSTANSAVSKANNAQGSANTANSNAANAQNRVGNLETCIKMTTDGVRVGKISNGNFSGYSALVNSAGSYDIMDGGSSVVARFNSSGIDMMNGNFWINGRPAIRNTSFDFYREFTSLDVPWRLWIKHIGNGMVWLRIAGTTNGNSVDQHGNIITESLPYSFDPSPFIGAMHVAMIPVGVCIFNIVDKTLALNAGKWAGGKVSYDGSMILMCDV